MRYDGNEFWTLVPRHGGPPHAFIEDATIVRPVRVMSASIATDTSAVDGYRQGIEITLQQYHDAGTIKISAGESGHQLPVVNVGQGTDTSWAPTTVSYSEFDRYNPIKRMLLTGTVGDTTVYESPRDEDGSHDAIARPIPRDEFTLNDTSPATGFRGIVLAGNIDNTGAADFPVTVLDVRFTSPPPFEDDVVTIVGLPDPSTIESTPSRGLPFVDRRVPGNFSRSPYIDTIMYGAISPMTGSTYTYLDSDHVSATTGWTYDVSVVGTDSIAFGGMTY